MQNLELKYYQQKKKNNNNHNLKLVVCQATGGICKRERIPDFLFGAKKQA